MPTSTWSGTATGDSFCYIAGYEVPFDPARLGELYSSHRDYVTKVAEDVVRLQAAGFLTWYDAAELIRQAQQADVV